MAYPAQRRVADRRCAGIPGLGGTSPETSVDVVSAVIGGGDSTPPAVSSISVSNITSSGGTVNWITDEPADGQVEIITPCASVPCLSALVPPSPRLTRLR
jgi:hypothetical protein